MNLTDPAGIDLAALRALVNSTPHEERDTILPDGKFPAISYLRVFGHPQRTGRRSLDSRAARSRRSES